MRLISEILEKLTGGDRRSIGRVPEVVQQVAKQPGLVADLVAGLGHDDPVVRMRSGDAIEKVSRRHAEWFRPLRSQLLQLASESKEQEIRWHLAQMLPRLDLTPSQRITLAGILNRYFADKSAIVRVSALQALADLAILDPRLRPRALERVRVALLGDGAAVRARARILLPALEGQPNEAPQPSSRTRPIAKGKPRFRSARR